jgi:hypothetical protein
MATRPFLRRGPSGPLAVAGAIVQIGYDVIREEMAVAPGVDELAFLPRNAALDPLEVIFPNFSLGDILEVDFRFSGVWEGEVAPIFLNTRTAVSLDDGATWYTLVPSCVGEDAAPAGDDSTDEFSMSSCVGIVITDPMPVVVTGVPGLINVTAAPRVRVFYQWNDNVMVNGGTDELTLPDCTLKCTEIDASVVFQGPFGQLAQD